MDEKQEAIALANRVLDKPYIDPDGDICLLARQFLRAIERETGDESSEFFIDFNTKQQPGKIQAVRVRLDMQTIEDMEKPLNIALCDHPLYPELKNYVRAN
jgi:hypothetical protein